MAQSGQAMTTGMAAPAPVATPSDTCSHRKLLKLKTPIGPAGLQVDITSSQGEGNIGKPGT